MLAAAILAALASCAPPVAAAPQRHLSCTPKGAKAFGASERLRVFSVPNGSGGTTGYVCDLREGTRRKLWRGAPANQMFAVRPRFAGLATAYELRRCGEQRCTSIVASREVASGLMRHAEVPIGPVHDVVVAPNGSAAFVSGGSQPVVTRLTPDGGEQLDGGPLVQPGSLALSPGSRLYWTNSGFPRMAQLDDEPQRLPSPTSFGGHERCYPKRSRTEAASTRVRAYTRVYGPEEERVTEYVACDLRSGRRTELESFSDPETSVHFDQIRVAGAFVAYAGFGCFKADCGSGVVRVIDARTGRTTARSLMGPTRGVRVTDLVLGADGAVAWMTAARGVDGVAATPAVHRCDETDCAKVDEGAGIDPASLALSEGASLYWTRDGEPRGAPGRRHPRR